MRFTVLEFLLWVSRHSNYYKQYSPTSQKGLGNLGSALLNIKIALQ